MFKKVYAADFSSPMTNFFAHLLGRTCSCMWHKANRLCRRVGESRGQFLSFYGADFGSTVSTGAFMLLVKKIPRLCIFERTVPPVCAQKRSAS